MPPSPESPGPSVPPRVVDLAEAFSRVEGLWRPHLAGELNGQHVKLARIEGAFDWHAHPQEDELFLVVKGAMRLEFRTGERELFEGQMCIVPRGVEHRPVADEECWILMFEPAGTVNTGDAPASERTVGKLPRI
jgi:mannose-6-phosphate isomerase-like protein (cupin superfamily)